MTRLTTTPHHRPRVLPGRTAFKYWLLQLPGTALLIVVLLFLRDWFGLSGWWVWGIVVIWVAKDAALYPLLRHAYEVNPSQEAHAVIGEVGVAHERLAPRGYVRVRGELWHAELLPDTDPIEAGQRVQIMDARGLTLLVRSEKD